MRRYKSRAGFTMAELLVVLTIVAIMSAVAVPFLVQLGGNARDELNRSARSVLTLLKAAQTYASTYNVKTAVVYGLDNYLQPQEVGDPDNNIAGALANPIGDSVTNTAVRAITQIAVMYQLPVRAGAYANRYVMVPMRNGEFNPIDGGMVIFVNDAETGNVYFDSLRPRYDRPGKLPGETYALGNLGMTDVDVYLDGTGPYTNGPASETVQFPAHVFTPNGALMTPSGASTKERYVVQVGPPPNFPPDVRLIDPSIVQVAGNQFYIPIEIFRASGRVKLGQRL